MLINILKVSLLAPLLATQSVSAADQTTGNVVKVSDGHTVTLLVNGAETIKVRRPEIDAPETNQPWGNKSKQALSLLMATKNE